MKKIEVVAAILITDKKVLCVQRPENKFSYISRKFEFPGGKIEPMESKEQALKREILEELELEILDLKEFVTVEHEYPDFYLVMHSFTCSCRSPNAIRLNEHIDHKWLNLSDLPSLDWAAADIPIVELLQKSTNELF